MGSKITVKPGHQGPPRRLGPDGARKEHDRLVPKKK